jgi:hypothetical protein
VGWAKPTGRANARPMTGSACPPSIDESWREGWARFALPTLRSWQTRTAELEAVDAWRFVESDYDHLRIHEPHEMFALLPGYSQGQSGNTNLLHINSQSNNLMS